MTVLVACVCAWVLGGIPFGFVIVRAVKGVDIRTLGSGSVGATNASRAFPGRGRPVFFGLFYLLDFAKGLFPTLYGAALFGLGDGPGVSVLIGACAVLGHCASPFLRLRGGKGVATTNGVFAALEPLALLIALVVFLTVLLSTRRVYWGSLALGLVLPLVVIGRDLASAFDQRLTVSVLALVAAGFLFFTHRSNLRQFFASRSETERTQS